MRNQTQLVIYADRLGGGGLRELTALLDGPLAGLFGGVHLLPFFHPIDGADAGFDPIDHTRVDPRLSDWPGVRALAARVDVTADLIVNHVYAGSPQFQDFVARGDASHWASRPNENCSLRIRFASSTPAKVIAAVLNDFKPALKRSGV
jgi:sucrose phosphorylase